MAEKHTGSEVQVGAQGRLVIPASLRRAMNLKSGDRLIARKVGESLVLERLDAVLQRLQDRFSHVPADVDLADELALERRKAAAQE